MRYRIVKRIHGDGSETYMPQHGILWGLIWGDAFYSFVRMTKEQCEDYIREEVKSSVKRVEVC